MLLDRYLLRELLGPLSFALGILGALMSTGFVLFGLIEESARFHYPLSLMLKVMLLKLPEMLTYTLPMALLLGSMLAISRLASDQELLILRLNGLSFWRLLAPLLGLALLLVSLNIALNELLVPPSNWLARQALHHARTGELTLPAQQSHLMLRDSGPEGLRHLIYARENKGPELRDVVIQRFEKGQLRFVLTAPRAFFEAGSWRFEKGRTLQIEPEKDEIMAASFESYQMPLAPELPALLQENRQPQELSLRELRAQIQRLETLGQPVAALKVRWQQKLAIPVSGLLFVVLGSALGARTLRSRSQGLGLSLLMVFGYYLLMSLGTALGDSQQVPVWLGAWLPHLLLWPPCLGLVYWRDQQG